MRGELAPAVHELVGRLDAIDAIHVVQPVEAVEHQFVLLIPENGVDAAVSPDDDLDGAAELGDNLLDLGELSVGQFGLLTNDHDCIDENRGYERPHWMRCKSESWIWSMAILENSSVLQQIDAFRVAGESFRWCVSP